jgi:hypothetical protein
LGHLRPLPFLALPVHVRFAPKADLRLGATELAANYPAFVRLASIRLWLVVLAVIIAPAT